MLRENVFNANSEASMYEQAIANLTDLIRPDSLKPKERIADRIKFSTFVERTSGLVLEPWQVHLCNTLETLSYTKNRRVLFHKPPQHGGSVIVSQRFGPYVLAQDPISRLRLACFNIDRASDHGEVMQGIMMSREYEDLFPDPMLRLPGRAQSKEEFSTLGRKRIRDGQSSFKALGLATGFTGSGAEHLIIDDPYSSADAADSIATRKATWSFWERTAKNRVDDNSNVIVMFHRYNEEDFVAQLIEEEGLVSDGGRWELYCYRAEWDGDERPEVGGPDPIGRKVGEYLSQRKAIQKDYYPEQKKNLAVWNSMFQGKPSGVEGTTFLVKRFNIVEFITYRLIAVCRAWDIAYTTDGDFTVGVLMGLGDNDRIVVLDVVRERLETDARNELIKSTVRSDYIRYRDKYTVSMPEDPAAGKDLRVVFTKLLKGYELVFRPTRNSKEIRADPWAGYVNAGLVDLLKDEWNKDYVEEHRKFPHSGKKDQIDSSGDGFSQLTLGLDLDPGQDFDTMGFLDDEGEYKTPEQIEQEIINDLMTNGGDELGAIDYGYYDFTPGQGRNSESVQTAVSTDRTAPSKLRARTIRERQDALKAKTRRIKH